jgi:hypothetical protein
MTKTTEGTGDTARREAPDWATPDALVYELHCTTRGYRTMKKISTRVAHVTKDAVVLANGERSYTGRAHKNSSHTTTTKRLPRSGGDGGGDQTSVASDKTATTASV